MRYAYRMSADEIHALWGAKASAAKALRNFGQSCARSDASGAILYIVKINEGAKPDMNLRMEIFNTLRASNIASPSMRWPYLSLSSEGSLAVCRLVVPKLMVWDFKTGKRLN